jgi:hypothetical protein
MAPQPPANTSHLRSKANENEKKRDKKKSTKSFYESQSISKKGKHAPRKKDGENSNTAQSPKVQKKALASRGKKNLASLCIGE